jgi:hypothetical protein
LSRPALPWASSQGDRNTNVTGLRRSAVIAGPILGRTKQESFHPGYPQNAEWFANGYDAPMAAFSDTTVMGRYDYQYDHAADPMEPDPGQTIEHAMGDVINAFEELDVAIASAISGILTRGGIRPSYAVGAAQECCHVWYAERSLTPGSRDPQTLPNRLLLRNPCHQRWAAVRSQSADSLGYPLS